MKYYFKSIFVLLLIAGITTTGCENFLEPSVDQNLPTSTIVQSVDDLESLVLGIHDDLNRVDVFGRDFYVAADVSSDNAFSNQNSGRFVVQSQLNYTVNSGYAEGVWDVFYESIATANVVINDENVASSPQVDYVKGQAHALRAFSHMNLLLAFGQQFISGGNASLGVPYITTYNEGNLIPPRDAIADVWASIGSDLSEAASLMDPALDDGNPAYISYAAVKALQSRYYLYTGNYGEAVNAADAILSGYTPVSADNLVSEWMSGSGPNSVFELAFTSTDGLGSDNIARILRNTNYGDVEATQDLYDAYAEGDVRLDLFTVRTDTVRMSYKYVDEANGSDNVRIIRYAEVWLNKAEALAKQGNLVEAISMINTLSSARGSSRVYTVGTQAQVVADVVAERRLELAFEGQRLFDMMRNEMDLPFLSIPGRGVNYVTGGPVPYGNYRMALPIPQAEMDANSSMVQNEGYN